MAPNAPGRGGGTQRAVAISHSPPSEPQSPINLVSDPRTVPLHIDSDHNLMPTSEQRNGLAGLARRSRAADQAVKS
jgi:hypothetical protein